MAYVYVVVQANQAMIITVAKQKTEPITNRANDPEGVHTQGERR